MVLIHKVLAVEMEHEREGKVKPDKLSEEERKPFIRLSIDKEIDEEKKEAEIMYWFRIGSLMVEGLTMEQAREKMYQDLVNKGDLKKAEVMRQFQDKIHPLQSNNPSPPAPPSPSTPT